MSKITNRITNKITKTKVVAIILLSVVFRMSCTPVIEFAPTESTNVLPRITFTPLSPIIAPTQNLATSTDSPLPINEQNYDGEYCQPPSVKLSSTGAQGLSDDKIAEKLMDLWLVYFYVIQAPDWCRIDGYTVDKVYYDERTPFLSLEPKGDIMRIVQYSIKLVQKPSYWASSAGNIDQKNWLHTANHIAIFRLKDGYTMKFAYP